MAQSNHEGRIGESSQGAGTPDITMTAHIGCQLRLDSASGVPVRHWIELLEADA